MESWMSTRLDMLPGQNLYAAMAIAVFVGLLYCFFGYKLLKLLLGVSGFLVAGSVAATGAAWASTGNVVVIGIAAFLGGLCGAMAVLFIFRLAIFLVGAAAAGVVAYEVLSGRPETWIPWAMIGLAFAGGILTVMLERAVMAIATAALGGWIVSRAGSLLIVAAFFPERVADKAFAQNVVWATLGAWALLTLVGAAFQIFMRRRNTA
jgi:hypothetical protein